jgi:AraC-like DNA-binding protein
MTATAPRRPSTSQDYHERILRVLLYIQQHLDDDLGLEDVAAAAAFSPFHFHRIFRGLVGETLGEQVPVSVSSRRRPPQTRRRARHPNRIRSRLRIAPHPTNSATKPPSS